MKQINQKMVKITRSKNFTVADLKKQQATIHISF